jgi:hypothetical protein
VANSAITLAKEANGTANSLKGFNGSGAPAVVSVGSGLALSGGTLTASGLGVLLRTDLIASPVSFVDYNNTLITNTYSDYLITFTGVSPSSVSSFYLRLSTDNGSSFLETAGDYWYATSAGTNANAAIFNGSQSATGIMLSCGTVTTSSPTDIGFSGSVVLRRPRDPLKTTIADGGFYFYQHSGGRTASGETGGHAVVATAHNAVRLLYPGASITEGVIKLYGII